MPGDEDLLDYAAFHTLRHGGTVYPLTGEGLSRRGGLAAILRP